MNKSKFRFSVIISAYNVEEYIERAIDSVLNQNFDDFEIIVVEDKSVDSTLEKILKYKDKINIIKNEKNMGLGAVRNIGIENSNGEYIIHLDGDDALFNNDTLSDIDKLIGEKKPDIVFLGFKEIGAFNRVRVSNEENSTREARLLCDTMFSVPSKCWKKDFLKENNIKFIEDVYYEDMIYSIEAVTLAKETMYGEFPIFIYYRNRTGSIMTTPTIKRCVDMYKMLAYLMEIYDKTPKELKPYLLSFIVNETQSLPYKIKEILKAIENSERSPLFKKREYQMVDFEKLKEIM